MRVLVGVAVTLLATPGVGVQRTQAHVFVFEYQRVGTYPPYDGSGWIGEAFLNIPDTDAEHLIAAEAYVEKREPDFTFRTPWIDFPAGPVAFDLDANFETIGDFLDDYVYDVSKPSKLDEPFGNFLLRFTGLLRVTLWDDVSLPGPDTFGLPVWVEFGSIGFDGFRTRIVSTIYRLPIVYPANPFSHENSIIHGLGLFPIEITYFNRYDPLGEHEPPMEWAGLELYSWHGGGLPWPAGDNLVHSTRGPATIVPPRVIYQEDDILAPIKGDFDADGDIDLGDAQWFQMCYTGPPDEVTIYLDAGCSAMDSDDDEDVDLLDLDEFVRAVAGPGELP